MKSGTEEFDPNRDLYSIQEEFNDFWRYCRIRVRRVRGVGIIDRGKGKLLVRELKLFLKFKITFVEKN